MTTMSQLEMFSQSSESIIPSVRCEPFKALTYSVTLLKTLIVQKYNAFNKERLLFANKHDEIKVFLVGMHLQKYVKMFFVSSSLKIYTKLAFRLNILCNLVVPYNL